MKFDKNQQKERKHLRQEILVQMELLRRRQPDAREWTGNEPELVKVRELYRQIEYMVPANATDDEIKERNQIFKKRQRDRRNRGL